MGFVGLLFLAFGLSMDAFAVSVCKGLAMQKTGIRESLLCGVWFGGFQALMPIIGFYLGATFAEAIESVDHWIALLLLCAIGGNMLKEALSQEKEQPDPDLSVKTLFLMAVATSIDALAVGISLAVVGTGNIFTAAALIGIVTFWLSGLGVKAGSIFGGRYERKAEFFGGLILIGIGIRILLSHLGVI